MTDNPLLLEEAKARVQLMTDSLPEVVDPASISLSAKIPYKAILYREALIWRTEELARCACDLYHQEAIVSAIILTRATTENAAAIWYLMQLIQNAAQDKELDEQIMQLLMGSRSNNEMPDAVHVLKMLRKAEKSIPGIFSAYESLSEYAHPNWSGTSRLYSKTDPGKFLTHLGKNVRSIDPPLGLGLNSLIAALAMFEYAYNKISDLMPGFVSVCETTLRDSK